jgi:hypothetical protein
VRLKIFNRYELKYLLTRVQYELLVSELKSYMEPDEEGDEHGSYSITSLYYDTDDHKAYWDKVEGHKYRRKVRIRVYDDQAVSPETDCFLEIKQRLDKTLQKRRVSLPYSSAEALCGAGEPIMVASETDQAVISEVRYLHDVLQLQPTCIVSYRRLAFNGSEYDPGLRVTFDTNLKSRSHALTLLSAGQAENHYFIPPEWCIMEVKVNYRVPYWLTEVIGRYHCPLRRISKYCAALEQSKALLQTQRIFY